MTHSLSKPSHLKGGSESETQEKAQKTAMLLLDLFKVELFIHLIAWIIFANLCLS